MSDLPGPLTPADCDLRDFAFMPLDVQRLMTSETWVLGSAEQKVAALSLWMQSWHQVPAASLPDNDKMLAHLSGIGPAWKRVREHALRGWKKCTDGRLYHAVVAEKALEAWAKKLAQRDRGRRGNAVRWGSRKDASHDPSPIPEGSPDDRTRIAEGLPEGSPDDRKGQGQGKKEPPFPPASGGHDAGSTLSSGGNGHDPGTLLVAADDPILALPGVQVVKGFYPDTLQPAINGYYADHFRDRLFEAAGFRANGWTVRQLAPIAAWLADGFVPDSVVGVVAKMAARPGYKPPASLNYFDAEIRRSAKREGMNPQ